VSAVPSHGSGADDRRAAVPAPVAAYGFDDDEETRRLLRSRPPRAALAWAERALGGTITAAWPLRGGTASAVHLLTVRTSGGAVERVVLRRYVRPEAVIEEPDVAEREARALQFVAGLDLGAGVATPQLLALDATGTLAGVPALVLSRIAGRVEWFPQDVDRWLQRLAGLLPAIHAAPLPPPGVIRPFGPYRQASYQPPPWARRPRLWTRAVQWFHRPTPDHAGPAVFTHRDFHPGNLLWRRGRVSGVVDWAAASIGPACVDVGHCRGNLFPYGLEVADRFTAIWERLTGATYHPWADVVTIIGSLDGLREEPGSDRFLVEDALARAVAQLGRSP
jgi:aminoglycoside phosphotransferase (APT) family kinase protein